MSTEGCRALSAFLNPHGLPSLCFALLPRHGNMRLHQSINMNSTGKYSQMDPREMKVRYCNLTAKTQIWVEESRHQFGSKSEHRISTLFHQRIVVAVTAHPAEDDALSVKYQNV